jgi:hypothetical protein
MSDTGDIVRTRNDADNALGLLGTACDRMRASSPDGQDSEVDSLELAVSAICAEIRHLATVIDAIRSMQ